MLHRPHLISNPNLIKVSGCLAFADAVCEINQRQKKKNKGSVSDLEMNLISWFDPFASFVSVQTHSPAASNRGPSQLRTGQALNLLLSAQT